MLDLRHLGTCLLSDDHILTSPFQEDHALQNLLLASESVQGTRAEQGVFRRGVHLHLGSKRTPLLLTFLLIFLVVLLILLVALDFLYHSI